ncbi:hypothetical protein BVRB_4g075440 [Beta vulgaris subsp. vulgaris]|nr:hypothetical protein BVRB_4g075440 [Beta vulgaris subsp. vulgaris]
MLKIIAPQLEILALLSLIGSSISSPSSDVRGSQFDIALPHCSDKCGNITVPYPFGTGDGCHYGNSSEGIHYNLTCDHTTDPPSIKFGPDAVDVVSVNLDGELLANHYASYSCFEEHNETSFVMSIALGRLTIAPTRNSLVAIGCDTFAWFSGTGITNGTLFNSGCMTVCNYAQKDLLRDKCSGIGCCLGFIPEGVNNISIEAKSFDDHLNVSDFNPCSVAFMVANDAMPHSFGDLLTQDANFFRNLKLPVIHHWSIGTEDCETAKSSGEYICKANSECIELPFQRGYRCKCNLGFQGNPYLHDCQDIDECGQGNNTLCIKPAYCVNTVGSYECLCPEGYSGKGTNNDPCILDLNTTHRGWYKLLVGLSVALGSILSFLATWWLYLRIKRRQVIKQRAKYFERNGGLLLQQQVSSDEVVERIKIFTIDKLEKATDHFNEDRILGQGGRGTVYKGMLGEGRIVAIKKSKVVDGENQFPITWKMRLQIASDAAAALAYLHYSSYIPIFHRDIKSSNILLDNRYRAKLSDFGTSRIVATDKTHVTTRVMGTFGYLDPEYFRSSQFTEKSDVYSFGVVLVELLTGQKAIRATTEDLEQDRSLISWFLSHMKNSSLLDILDCQVLKEGSMEEFLTIAELANRCLKLDGKRRPTMKEVLLEIEMILSLHLPRMNESNRPESEQVFAETTLSSHYDCVSTSCTFNLESITSLSSAEESLLFNTR